MLFALLLVACAAIETAEIDLPNEPGPDRIHYAYPGVDTVIEPGTRWEVECHEPASLVVEVGDRLCSVVGDGLVLDADDDGLCELSPPVTLAVSVWR